MRLASGASPSARRSRTRTAVPLSSSSLASDLARPPRCAASCWHGARRAGSKRSVRGKGCASYLGRVCGRTRLASSSLSRPASPASRGSPPGSTGCASIRRRTNSRARCASTRWPTMMRRRRRRRPSGSPPPSTSPCARQTWRRSWTSWSWRTTTIGCATRREASTCSPRSRTCGWSCCTRSKTSAATGPPSGSTARSPRSGSSSSSPPSPSARCTETNTTCMSSTRPATRTRASRCCCAAARSRRRPSCGRTTAALRTGRCSSTSGCNAASRAPSRRRTSRTRGGCPAATARVGKKSSCQSPRGSSSRCASRRSIWSTTPAPPRAPARSCSAPST
mmetsp:Transcript_15642/g.49396  ORF Transcript_15642/g.49396 Transcript_15642/m.49396 type:complete len:336 (+) Transcript_15642:2182-3189(+)